MPEKITGGLVQLTLYIAAGVHYLATLINLVEGVNAHEPLTRALLFTILLYVTDEQ